MMPRDSFRESSTSHKMYDVHFSGQINCVLISDSDTRRFWSKVRIGAVDACWPWIGSINRGTGYGQFTITTDRQSRTWGAHRVAWTLTFGPIPPSQSVLHRCDYPSCCNPAHFFLGTQLHNMQDAARKGRLHVKRPKRHKVTTTQLAEIDALLKSGELQVAIAARYGVTKTWVCLYAKGLRRQYDRPARLESVA